jgi:hypothetical protein
LSSGHRLDIAHLARAQSDQPGAFHIEVSGDEVHMQQ